MSTLSLFIALTLTGLYQFSALMVAMYVVFLRPATLSRFLLLKRV